MAVHADLVWEVQTGGNDNNGGGFKSSASGTDRSTSTTAHATLTTASTVNSTTTIIDVDSGDYTCTDADVGNVLQITGGTATAGFYEITARSAQQWTLDRSAGTSGQTVVGSMGGCLATPGKVTDLPMVDGNLVWIKSGTYTMTTTTAGAAGPMNLETNNATVIVKVEGYQTTRGDRGTKPLIDAGTQNTFTMVTFGGSYQWESHTLVNLEVDGNSNTSVRGFDGAASEYKGPAILECKATACTNYGFADCECCIACEADTCNIGFYRPIRATYCWSHDCTSHGFVPSTAGGQNEWVHCIASNNGGDGFYQDGSGYGGQFINCVAYKNTGDGFAGIYNMCHWIGCIATENTGFGWDMNNHAVCVTHKCFSYSNTAGESDQEFRAVDDITALSGDPFTNAASDDYSLNNTAGAGADCRAVLAPAGQTAYMDAGAAQHVDPAGGSGGGALVNSGLVH